MSTAINSNSIITGSASLFVAPRGTPLPTFPADLVTQIVLDPAWTGVGSTDGGIETDYSPTMKNIMVDEAMSPIKVIKTAEALTVTANLAEATLQNLSVVLNGATFTSTAATNNAAGYNKLSVGGSQAYSEYALLIIGPGPIIPQQGQTPAFTTTRFFHIYRAFSTAKVKQSYKKDDKVMIPVEFTGLCDTSRPIGDQLAEILEKTSNHS